jgi:hypothetical protein
MNRRIALLSLVFLLSAPSMGEAAAGSRYLTLDHWAYEAIRLLQGAGHLEGLSALVQPYHRDQVAREVQSLDPGRLSPGLAHWARLLQKEFAGEGGDAETGVRWGSWIGGGARASTSGRTDRSGLSNEGDLWPTAGPRLGRHRSGRAGGRASRRRVPRRGPDGIDPQRRVGRSETAYLSVAVPFGELAIGRFARNWSRLGSPGLMVGRKATPTRKSASSSRPDGSPSIPSWVSLIPSGGSPTPWKRRNAT